MTSRAKEERLARLLGILRDACARGVVCPSNPELAADLDVESVASPVRLIKTLEDRGFITVERWPHWRVVTDRLNGRKTAPLPKVKAGKPKAARQYSRERVQRARLKSAQAQAEQHAGQQREEAAPPDLVAKAPPPPSYAELLAKHRSPRVAEANDDDLPPAASRNPCIRCGVPGFRGCEHQAPYEPLKEKKLCVL